MNQNLSFILKAKIGDGKLNELKVLADKFCQITKDEAGALSYEWSISPNEKILHIYERYSDTDAAMVHLENIGAELPRLLELVEITEVECYGIAGSAFKEAAKDLPVVYFDTFCGFRKP